MHNHIFLVEDDDKVAQLLTTQLQRFGYNVTVAKDLRRVDDEVRQTTPDLVLLDINLPYYDGFYWCRQLRTFTKAPIVFLSARDGAMDQVFALENGGDEYMTKPFHPDVVLAKVKALLRRAYGEYADEGAGTIPQTADSLVADPLLVDLRKSTMTCNGHTQDLTKTELQLLRRLLEAKGRVVERHILLEALWDDTDFVDDNTLTVNVARVRRKLAVFALEDALVTVRGMGYRFDVSAADDREGATS